MQTHELILRPRKIKTIIQAIASLGFVLIGAYLMYKTNGEEGLIPLVFFGICLIVFVVQLLPGSAQLKLTKDGFIITSLFQSHLTKWDLIKEFNVGNMGIKGTLMFDYVDNYTQHKTGRRLARFLSGSQGALPDTYGMKAEDLQMLMTEWKEKYSMVN